jgi:hypothetical protein
MSEVRVLPLVRRDGSYVAGAQGIEQFQVVGGPYNGRRGGWHELSQLTGAVIVADDCEAISAETGAILEEARLQITIGAEEQIRLAELAAQRGVTAEELIESFVADLTKSLRNNGSDERMHAEQWLNRVCWPGSTEEQ